MERGEGNGVYSVLLIPAAAETRERIAGLLPLSDAKPQLQVADDLPAALKLLGLGGIDVILFEARSMNALAKALSQLRDLFPQTPVIILSDREDMSMCDRALQDGAQDYLLKDRLTPFGLARSIRFAIDRQRVLALQDRDIRELSADLELHRMLVERSPDGLLVVGEEGTVFFANPMASRILGRMGAELVAAPFGYPVIEGAPSEMEIVRKDQESVVAELTASETIWEGEASYVVSLRETTARAEREFLQRRRIEAERLVSMVSTLFVSLEPERIDHGMQESLRMLGEFVRADRAVVWMHTPDGLLVRPSFEWAAPGVPSALGKLAGLPRDDMGWLGERLAIFGTALVSDVKNLPQEAAAERMIMRERGVETLIAVTMARDGLPMGFVVLEALRAERMWSEEDIGLLRTASDIFAAALHRRHGDIEGRALRTLLDALIRSDPDGILVEDRSGAIVQTNDRALDLVGLAGSGEGLTAPEFMRRLADASRDPDAFRADAERMFDKYDASISARIALQEGGEVAVDALPLFFREKIAGRLWRLRRM